MYKRKIYNKILEWKKDSDGKTALLIEGARRIGKSTVVEEFGKNEYKSYILIDFSSATKKIIDLFDDVSDINYLFLQLQLIYHVDLYDRESLIIFDEVELCPKARQAIKFLVKDHRYDYIETGSLISIRKNVNDILIPSEEHAISMYPMDFEEFYQAVHNDDSTIEILKEKFDKKEKVGEAAHRKILRDFRLYMLVGGMPQAIESYIDTNNFSKVDKVKRDIINLYNEDFIKIDNTGKASMIYNAIPSQLANKASRYHVSSVLNNSRAKDILGLIKQLESSKTILMSYNVTDPNVGLEGYKDLTKFKIFMSDSGLFITQMFKNKEYTDNVIYEKLLSDKLPENLGYVYENAIAVILKRCGHELYYHTFRIEDNPHNYEIDFLISEENKIAPIEVKSSKTKGHKSMDKFVNKYHSRIQNQYLICSKDVNVENDIITLPYYMTMFL